jgi:hypothetical protein
VQLCERVLTQAKHTTTETGKAAEDEEGRGAKKAKRPKSAPRAHSVKEADEAEATIKLEQATLDECEFEWIRQFYFQVDQIVLVSSLIRAC